MFPQILVWQVEGSKGQIWPENGFFWKYLKNASSGFLILYMMLDHNKCFLAAYVACYRKFSFGGERGQKLKFGPNLSFWDINEDEISLVR